MIFPFENDTDAIVKKLAKRSLQILYVFGGSYQTPKFYQGRLQAAVLYAAPELFTALSDDENIEIAGLSLTVPLKEIRVGRDRLSVNFKGVSGKPSGCFR